MRPTVVLLAFAGLQSGCTPCNCDANGAPVDFTAITPDLQALMGTSSSGTVVDQPGDERPSVTYQPCALAEQPFSMTLTVADPVCDDPAGPGTVDCSDALTANYAITGSMTIGGGSAIALDGSVDATADQQLVHVQPRPLASPPGDFPLQDLEFVFVGTVLDDMSFGGLKWSRRLSADNADPTVWEVCSLPVGG